MCFQPRWIKWTLQIFHMVHIPYFLHWRRAFSQISPLLLAMVKRWLINNLIVWIMKSILAFIVNFYLTIVCESSTNIMPHLRPAEYFVFLSIKKKTCLTGNGPLNTLRLSICFTFSALWEISIESSSWITNYNSCLYFDMPYALFKIWHNLLKYSAILHTKMSN